MTDSRYEVLVKNRRGGLTRASRKRLSALGVKKFDLERMKETPVSAKKTLDSFKQALPDNIGFSAANPFVVLEIPGIADVGPMAACQCKCSHTLDCGGGGGGG